MLFQIKHYLLPHDGIIPGARGHKKITIPQGTKAFFIVYGTKIFWCGFLTEAEALKTAKNLEDTTIPGRKRYIDLQTLLAFNFKSSIPSRIKRPSK